MNDADKRLAIGQIVLNVKGREQGKYAFVIKQLDDRFVFIADGDKRKFDRPKKKNILHLEFLDYVADEVRQSILQSGKVTNSKLRYAMNKFLETLPEAQSKGE